MNTTASSTTNSSTSIASLETPTSTSSNSKRSHKHGEHHVTFTTTETHSIEPSDDEDALHAEIDAMSRSTSSVQLEEMDPHVHVESILANITEEPSIAKHVNIGAAFKPTGLKPSASNISLCSVAAAVPMKFKQEDLDDNKVNEYSAHAEVSKALDFRQLGPQDFEKLKLLGKGGL